MGLGSVTVWRRGLGYYTARSEYPAVYTRGCGKETKTYRGRVELGVGVGVGVGVGCIRCALKIYGVITTGLQRAPTPRTRAR